MAEDDSPVSAPVEGTPAPEQAGETSAAPVTPPEAPEPPAETTETPSAGDTSVPASSLAAEPASDTDRGSLHDKLDTLISHVMKGTKETTNEPETVTVEGTGGQGKRKASSDATKKQQESGQQPARTGNNEPVESPGPGGRPRKRGHKFGGRRLHSGRTGLPSR